MALARVEILQADIDRGHDRPEARLPPVDAGEYLIDYLLEVGPAVNGEPVSFREIEAWCLLTGRDLEPWEVTALRRLSVAYLNEAMDAHDPKRPPPAWPKEKPTRAQVSSKIEAILSRLEAQDAKSGRR